MKSKTKVNYLEKSVKELEKLAIEMKNESIEAYAKIKAGKEKNLKKSRNIRKELARVLTFIRQKEIIQNLEKSLKEKKE